MINCDWLTRITTNKAGAVALACRVLSAATILLSFGFVLAYPACAKDEPKYVGDFPDQTKRQNIQIIDDGPVTVQYRHAPIVVVPAGSEVRPPMLEVQKQLPRVGKHYPADTKSVKTEIPTAVKVNKTGDFEPSTFNFPPDLLPGTTGDFPLPKPNFPREIGPAGKHAIPMTASPSALPVQAKPMRAGGAAQKGDASRLIKPADRRASAVPIKTYSSGYVPGSALTDGKPNGCKLRAR